MSSTVGHTAGEKEVGKVMNNFLAGIRVLGWGTAFVWLLTQVVGGGAGC